MKKEDVYQSIEKILDEWDPIGLLQGIEPIIYNKGSIGEYSEYIKPIIVIYLSNQSINDYLIKIQTELWDYPNEEMKAEIQAVSEKIYSFLSQCKVEYLQ